ncbi:MAG TPA: C-GCAxxG-C-C family protein [Halanaerobiales bacterium]|nr:C-GCAxxG-C-C family protein [Halanaerobiales bacterium]
MDMANLIQERVHDYYWNQDLNCATSTLKILAEITGIDLQQQVINAAAGMHGAGGYRAQCGLVEGALMFTGIIGHIKGLTGTEIIKNCYNYAEEFEKKFGSLLCKELRPEGFREDNPPHLCEGLTVEAIEFTAKYLLNTIEE